MPLEDTQHTISLKPPAVTTGSPGTAIFIPQPSSQSPPNLHFSAASTSSSPAPDSHSRPFPSLQSGTKDHCIPPEWSFESTYGLYGGGAASIVPVSHTKSTLKQKKDYLELREGANVLGGSWFKKKDKERSRMLPNPTALSEAPIFNDTSAEHFQSQETCQMVPPIITYETSLVASAQTEELIPVASQTATSRRVISAHSSKHSSVRSQPLRSVMRPHTSPFSSHANNATQSNNRPRRQLRANFLATPLASIPDSSVPPTHAPSPSLVFSNEELSSNCARSLSSASITRPVFGGDRANCEDRDEGVNMKEKNIQLLQASQKPRLRRPATVTGVKEFQSRTTGSTGVTLNAIGTGTIGNVLVPPMVSNISTIKTPYPSQGLFVSAAGTSSVTRKETPIGTFRRRRNEEREKGFVMKNKRRHHPRSKTEAPYPRDYENRTVDHDKWQNAFTTVLAGSVSFHSFTTPPAKVLDLGCGTGDWILDCAREWKTTTFVGVDLVPIQPDLARLGLVELSSRIQWVIANFLERLPFEDNSFDFVHIRRVARGVPEDKWHNLFEEITRVLREDGAFEMIEEDLFFPGSVRSMDGERNNVGQGMAAPDTTFEQSESKLPDTKDDFELEPLKDSGKPAAVGGHAMTTLSKLAGEPRPRLSLDSWRNPQPIPVDVSFALDEHEYEHNAMIVDERGPEQQYEGELFHTPPLPIMNPRDHSMLQTAYNELHTARFVNLMPLSILNSMIILYFRDVHTHESVELSFPSGEVPTKNEKSDPLRCESDTSHTISPPLLRLLPIGQALALDLLNSNKAHTQFIHGGFESSHLHMHLAARVTEVLACGEEMWDFIEECKTTPGRWKNPLLSALAEVTREEWEDCLLRYAMDMEDKIATGKLAQARFGWEVLASSGAPERKAFNEAVTKWETHCQKRLQNQSVIGNLTKQAVAASASPTSLLSRKFRVYIGKK